MKAVTYTGVWIDHREAIVVSISNTGERVSRIASNAEGHYRLSGGSRSRTPYGPQDVASEDRIERRRMQQLHRFYEKVKKAICLADAVFIFGPGEAKWELRKELREPKSLFSKIVGIELCIERADKMTDKQVVARVRAFFEDNKRAWGPRALR